MFEQLHDNRITALYCRLSRDDGFYEDSCSIVSQKSLLEKYAKEQGFDNCQFFVDDGYTGTNYDRPGSVLSKIAKEHQVLHGNEWEMPFMWKNKCYLCHNMCLW